jgi:Arc/MetJ-type ribon-helix-helix transcriptional regulator
MKTPPPPTSFRLTSSEREMLDSLSRRLGVSRPDVVRLAVRALEEEARGGGDGLRRAIVRAARTGAPT